MKNKVLIFMAVAIALFCFTGQAMAEYEESPWKNKSGKLGSSGRQWRIATIERVGMDYASVEKALVSTTSTTLSGTTTITGAVTMQDASGSFTIPLSEFFPADSSGPLAAATRTDPEPGLDRHGGLTAICFGSPPETTAGSPLKAGFAMPDSYLSGLGFRLWLVQSGWTEASPWRVDWKIWTIADQIVIDGAASREQTFVSLASGVLGSPSGSPDVVALVLNASGAADVAAAKFVFLELWATRSVGQVTGDVLFMHGVEGYFTKSQ